MINMVMCFYSLHVIVPTFIQCKVSVVSAHQQLLYLGLHHHWLKRIFVTEFL